MRSQKKKYKVCIVTAILPPSYGGAEVAAFKYATRLHNDADSEVIVLGWDRADAYERSDLKYEFVHSVQINENPKDAKGIFIYFQQLVHMWNCFKVLLIPMWKFRKNYDYVHNFNSGFAFNRVSIFIAKILGKKVITETSLVGDDDPLSLGRFLNWKDYLKPKYLRYLFYKMADRYVSKSEVITDIFRRSEISMNKVVQIPYSVDIHKFKPLDIESKKKLRIKLKIWEDGKIILFVGGINVRKGVHILVDAFISIEKRYPDLKLLIVGPTYKYDQKYISNILEKIKYLKLEHKILLTEKNVSNVEDYMQSSDIFVLPSRQEGFPISIIEAMSCGLAVVGSDIPEIAKTQITDSVDGYVFTKGDENKLSSVLCKILDDNDSTLKICNNAREKAVNNWSVEIVDKAYRELYNSIGKKKNPERKIRILYTIDKFKTPGREKEFLNIISGLDKNIFESSIWVLNNNEDLIKSASDNKIRIFNSNAEGDFKNEKEDSNNFYKYYKIFKKAEPDIIHSLNDSDSYSEAMAAMISGIKWVFTSQSIDYLNNNSSMRINLSDAIILQNYKSENGNLKEHKKQFKIPSGINIKEFSDIRRDESLILKYKITGSDPIILTSAENFNVKGLETLIKGFGLACEDYNKAKLLLVGEIDSEISDKLISLIREMNIEENVVFTGKQIDFKKFYGIADIFIFSAAKKCSEYSLNNLEAMSAGVLSFGSDIPGISEYFSEFQDQLFEAENPGSIANKILFVMNMEEDEIRERIIRQKEFVKKNYSLEKEIELLENIYKKII